MQGIFDYFASNPEAMATLLVCAVGGVMSIITWLISITAHYPLIARVLATRSLVHVDSALREKVQVTFSHRDGAVDVRELRQVDYEILNSHPRRRAEDCTITIKLCSPDTTVLGVSAANSDGRIPRLGGRRVVASVESIPAQPADPILGPRSEVLFPAVVVRIPYLERVVQNDRVFLRITYSGPELQPEIQGAKSMSAKRYETMQRIYVLAAANICVGVGLCLSLVAYSKVSFPPSPRELRDNLYFWFGMAAIIIGLLIGVAFNTDRRIRRFVRILPNPLIPPPVEADSLAGFHYYDTTQEADSTEKPIIHSAIYAPVGEEHGLDVTQRVQEKVAAGKLLIHVCNDELVDTDPYPGLVKQLRVDYEWAGERFEKRVRERENLRLP